MRRPPRIYCCLRQTLRPDEIRTLIDMLPGHEASGLMLVLAFGPRSTFIHSDKHTNAPTVTPAAIDGTEPVRA